MSNERFPSRRQFIAAGGSAVVTGVAGCSGGGGGSTPDDAGSTPSTEESSTPTAGTTPTDASESQYVIGSLSEYRNVAQNPDEWIGEEIDASDVSYYRSYEEDYQGFRMVFDDENTARPFMLKTDQEFKSGETISFSGTVEKTGVIQTVQVIFVESVTIE